MTVLLELLTVLLAYIDLSVIATLKNKCYTNILPIMLALCSMLSGTYYAHNYASIIGRSLNKYNYCYKPQSQGLTYFG